MQKTALNIAAALALATFGASTAFAQSTLTLYGNLDVAVDNVRKGQGNVVSAPGNLFMNPAYAPSFVNKSNTTRVTSSVSSVNSLGVKGTEDLGGGYKGSFVLEGQMQLDTGAQSGQDGRMWGRQAYLGLTTPFGEVRLGRQYAPMFYSFASATVEALGGADIQGSGLIANNLQVRQDNQVSYWLKSGGLTASVSYSPQAGVDQKISSARASIGTYTPTSGQIVGGASAGTEATNAQGRGRTLGLFVNYLVMPELLVNGSYHHNKFGDAVLQTATVVPLFNLDKYSAYSLAAKYTVPGLGTQVSGIWHAGKFSMDDGSDVKLDTIALGVKHPIDNFSVGAQVSQSKFTNFTKGKDTAVMLTGDYNFSKRTKLYVRAGYVKDDRGDLAQTTAAGVPIVGGPLPLLTGLGSIETPFFSGGGANIDATTRVIAVGVRHQF